MKWHEIIKKLSQSKLNIYTISGLKKLFNIESDNTAYKTAENLLKKGILGRISKGKYFYALEISSDFERAGFLYSPSYISLESALNYYGILSQFPYIITSLTPRKTKHFEAGQKTFDFLHINKNLFWGFEKNDNFLMATPEKALIDEIYFVAKGLRSISFEELDYSKINRRIFRSGARRISYLPFQKLLKGLKI